LIDKAQPGKFNQAMMEFGAMHCKPKNPDCEKCIFNDSCLAYQRGLVDKLPLKISKIKIKTRYLTYIHITFNQNNKPFTIIKKRNENDIWKGLYEFPLIESPKEIPAEDLIKMEQVNQFVNPEQSVIQSFSKAYAHQLTHQKIIATFIKISSTALISELPLDYIIIPTSSLGEYPVSRLMDKYLNDINI
jgi:A/G-specific adenine glycosylase